MPAMRDPSRDLGLPPWLADLLNNLAISPTTTAISGGTPVLRSIGKELSELLDTVFTTTKKTKGVPTKLRFTNLSREGNMQLHPASARGTSPTGPAPMEVAPGDLDRLISGGAVDLDQPPEGAVDAIRRRLQKVLGAQP